MQHRTFNAVVVLADTDRFNTMALILAKYGATSIRRVKDVEAVIAAVEKRNKKIPLLVFADRYAVPVDAVAIAERLPLVQQGAPILMFALKQFFNARDAISLNMHPNIQGLLYDPFTEKTMDIVQNILAKETNGASIH